MLRLDNNLIAVRALWTLPRARLCVVVGASVALGACSLWQVEPREQTPVEQAGYVAATDSAAPSVSWLGAIDRDDAGLVAAVNDALQRSPQVAQLAAQYEQAREGARVALANRLPTADLNLRGSRSQVGRNQVAQAGEFFNLALNVGWSADIWGQLAQAQRAAALRLAAAEARYENARRQLAADVASAWFNTIEARELLDVFELRLKNVAESAEVVESGYQQGINEALDLYLARNAVDQERSNVAAQRQLLREASNELLRLSARYPVGEVALDASLPELSDDIPVGLPADLLIRRMDVGEAWLNVLAADADVAVAQRARFPSLFLSGSGGRVSPQLANIISEGDESWSLAASLAAPLFDAGRRRAQVRQAKAQALEREQIYVQSLFVAFNEVENALSRNDALRARLSALIEAQKSAELALELALEQYGRGLVTFTTVLESQRRAFDATTQVVRLRNQQVQNRIALHLALGGEFEVEPGRAAALTGTER
jgi:NodT family efflux transporter outer membrane factor (OMF) lipoprotein